MKNADIIFAVLITGILTVLSVMLAYVSGEAHAVSLIQQAKEVLDNFGLI